MRIELNDIKRFGKLRKQLEPLLKEDANFLLEKIELSIGGAFLPTSQKVQKRKETHKERVARYLIPK